jgi:hypothetical protein
MVYAHYFEDSDPETSQEKHTNKEHFKLLLTGAFLPGNKPTPK